jgi:2-phosphosulfolactate phosphatase
MKTIEVLFTPAEFSVLPQRDLSETVCVVFDVLRATSTMVTALGNGAAAIVPVAEIAEALQVRQARPEVLLAGERDGLRIQADLTGSIAFDLGNSPREFTRDRVAGRVITMTTTNGTRGLRACAHARKVLLGSFLNLRATADWLLKQSPEHLLLVCGGTILEAAYEDVLGAGALCALLWKDCDSGAVADSALMAHRLFEYAKADLAGAAAQSRNGRRLLANPDLRDDVGFCLQRDTLNLVAALDREGWIRLDPAP